MGSRLLINPDIVGSDGAALPTVVRRGSAEGLGPPQVPPQQKPLQASAKEFIPTTPVSGAGGAPIIRPPTPLSLVPVVGIQAGGSRPTTPTPVSGGRGESSRPPTPIPPPAGRGSPQVSPRPEYSPRPPSPAPVGGAGRGGQGAAGPPPAGRGQPISQAPQGLVPGQATPAPSPGLGRGGPAQAQAQAQQEDASARPAPGSNRYHQIIMISDDDERNKDERDCAWGECHARDLKIVRVPGVCSFSPKLCEPHRREYNGLLKNFKRAERVAALVRAMTMLETKGPTGILWSQHAFAWEPIQTCIDFEYFLSQLVDNSGTWPSRDPWMKILVDLEGALLKTWKAMWAVQITDFGQPNEETLSPACPDLDGCGQVATSVQPPSVSTLTKIHGNNLFRGRTKLPLGLYLELMARTGFRPTRS